MEAQGYESITFKMKEGYSQRDLHITILEMKKAFSMSDAKVETLAYAQSRGSQPKGLVFRIYFKNGGKL